MSLLVVGSVAFDAVETPHGKVDRMLGGAATYFSVAASYFTHQSGRGIVGIDFTDKDESIFKGRRIDTQGLERADGKTFFWAGKYSENMNERTTLATELNVFAEFKPRLPEPYQSSTHIFLANIDPTLQASVLHLVKRRPRVVALDTMNYWIENARPRNCVETLKHTDILVINDSETRQLSNEHNLLRAARHIFKLGPKALVINAGNTAPCWSIKNERSMCRHSHWNRCTTPPARGIRSLGASWAISRRRAKWMMPRCAAPWSMAR